MIAPNPHYLLFCTTQMSDGHLIATRNDDDAPIPPATRGRWHFVLEQLDGSERLEVADSESKVSEDRLALLCIVRGLEALEQSSRVTLVTTSRYVTRGLKYGLNNWRESNYRWERFGVQKPVRNADLWRRVDGALGYHSVSCKLINAQSAPSVVVAETPEGSLAECGLQPASEAAATLPSPETQGQFEIAARTAAKPAGNAATDSDSRWSLAQGINNWVRDRMQPQTTLCGT